MNLKGKGKKIALIRFLISHSWLMHIVDYAFPNIYKGCMLFKEDMNRYNHLNKTNFSIHDEYIYPCLTDRFNEAGVTGLYFWQDLWAARLIAANRPKEHFDIGSRIDGFIAHLSCFMENIHLIDIRPFELNIPNVDFLQADATEMAGIDDGSIQSLSALCSLEHFGLGRYGDPIDPEACFKAMRNMERVLSKGGHAYISVPVGFERLEFNAFRVFYAKTIRQMFPHCELVEYSTTEGSCIERNIPIDKYDDEREYGGRRFGLFHFIKV